MISKAKETHLNEIVRVHRQVLPETSSSVLGPDFLKSLYRALLSDKNAGVWVYTINGRIVGFLSLTSKMKSTSLLIKKKVAFNDYMNIISVFIKKPYEMVKFLKRIYFERNVTGKYGDYPTILTIGVSPKHQKLGIGSKLINLSINYFKKAKLGKFYVDTEVRNSNAVKFYIRNNFKPVYYSSGSVLLQRSTR